MRRAILVTPLVLGLTGVACGGGGECTPSNAKELTGPLMIKDSNFSPNCFSVASGSTISVANEDGVAHTFTVPDTDVDVPLPVGGAGEATAPAPGTYDFLCTIHPPMQGTLIVI